MSDASFDALMDYLAEHGLPQPPSCQEDIDWTGVRAHDMQPATDIPLSEGLWEECADCGYIWELIPSEWVRNHPEWMAQEEARRTHD